MVFFLLTCRFCAIVKGSRIFKDIHMICLTVDQWRPNCVEILSYEFKIFLSTKINFALHLIWDILRITSSLIQLILSAMHIIPKQLYTKQSLILPLIKPKATMARKNSLMFTLITNLRNQDSSEKIQLLRLVGYIFLIQSKHT